jgi:hypothetical protein
MLSIAIVVDVEARADLVASSLLVVLRTLDSHACSPPQASIRNMPELQPAKPVNLDTVLYVLRKTLLSPVFAGLAALFTFLFQVTCGYGVLFNLQPAFQLA